MTNWMIDSRPKGSEEKFWPLTLNGSQLIFARRDQAEMVLESEAYRQPDTELVIAPVENEAANMTWTQYQMWRLKQDGYTINYIDSIVEICRPNEDIPWMATTRRVGEDTIIAAAYYEVIGIVPVVE